MGFPGLQHLRQTGARPQVPQAVALDLPDIAPGLFVQKRAVGPVAEDDLSFDVDDGNAFAHGVKRGPAPRH